MAFFGRLGNMFKHAAIAKNRRQADIISPSIFQSIRRMSSAPNTKLLIGGFHCSTDEQSLREAFSKYGQVIDARIIIMDHKTGIRRGFITYSSVEEASVALQALDGRDLHGYQVKVNFAAVKPGQGRGNGTYKLLLPSPPAVDLVSDQGKQLFREAIQGGTMEGFCRLISYFVTQCEPTFCGIASLSMVLNALAIDPNKKWKGPWRWFDESMLDCLDSLEEIKARGITFGKLVYLAHSVGAKVDSYFACHSTIEDFCQHVIKCSTSDRCFVISSYHRKALKQVGTGHFTPIGGYHTQKDMVLILDVARFKYPPHWVPLTVLWEAMNYVDESTGSSRGFMLISRPHREPAMLYTLSCKHESWSSIAKFLVDDVPSLLKAEDAKDMRKVLSVIVASLPSDFEEFIKWAAEIGRQEDGGQKLSEEEKTRAVVKDEIVKQVQGTRLFKHVASFLSHCCRGHTPSSGDGDTLPVISTGDGHTPTKSKRMHPASTNVLTVLLLALPSTSWDGITDEKLLSEIHDLVSIENLPLLLQEEVLFLRVELILDFLMIDTGAPPQ